MSNSDFHVRVRTPGGKWEPLFSYNVKVDMHDVRNASMIMFDCSGTVEIEVESNHGTINDAVIRPLAAGIQCDCKGRILSFTIDGPKLLSLEVNNDRFHNLHLFANPIGENIPEAPDGELLVLEPGWHIAAEVQDKLERMPASPGKRSVLFGPGIHRLDESLLRLPSYTSVYIPGDAIVYGGFVCDQVHDVAVKGRGILLYVRF